MKFLSTIILIVLVCVVVQAGIDNPPVINARQVKQGPRIDGSLHDPQWQSADWFSAFTQTVPNYQAPATERTEIAYLFDEENIYVGFKCFDTEPDKIVARHLMHRSDIDADDTATLLFDTYMDQKRGILFMVNPLGAKEEIQTSGNNSYNSNWNEVWEVKTQITNEGWEAEFRIPLRILRFRRGENLEWSINARRIIQRKREEVYINPPEPPLEIGSMHYHGILKGLHLDPDRKNIQLKPYILGGAVKERDSGEDYEAESEVGLDLKYLLTSDLTLDITMNTDFAQVESDEEQVNLTRFSLFFPEKRDFFLENSQIFDFGEGGHHVSVLPFFSRKIGLYRGQTVPIDVGARLTGKVGSEDIGLLSLRTRDVNELGLDDAFYNVARVRHSLDGRSFVGGIYTNSQRGDFSSSTYGLDGAYWITDRLKATGYILSVDQDDIEDQHMALDAVLDYTSDDYGYFVKHSEIGENFDPDLGFVRRKGFRQNQIYLRKSGRPGNLLRRYNIKLSSSWTELMDGPLESSNKSLELGLEMESGDNIELRYHYDFERLFHPFELDKKVVFTPGDYDFSYFHAEIDTSEKRDLSLSVEMTYGDFYDARREEYELGVSYSFNKHLQTEFDISKYYIYGDGYGDIDWTLIGLDTRYTFNSSLMISSFLQYNSESGDLSLNLRAHLIYGDDSDLFIVFNEHQIKDRFDKFQLETRQALVKINYRFYF